MSEQHVHPSAGQTSPYGWQASAGQPPASFASPAQYASAARAPSHAASPAATASGHVAPPPGQQVPGEYVPGHYMPGYYPPGYPTPSHQSPRSGGGEGFSVASLVLGI